MSRRKAIAGVVLLVLLATPVLALAGDALGSCRGSVHHAARVQHRPSRHWRTVPATLESRPPAPPIVLVTALDTDEPEHRLPVVVRALFAPPRG